MTGLVRRARPRDPAEFGPQQKLGTNDEQRPSVERLEIVNEAERNGLVLAVKAVVIQRERNWLLKPIHVVAKRPHINIRASGGDNKHLFPGLV